MPRKKDDGPDKDTLFLSMHLQLDRALKALGKHSAYDAECNDIRNLLRLSLPICNHILAKKAVVPPHETEQ